jgi:hypothetical protein
MAPDDQIVVAAITGRAEDGGPGALYAYGPTELGLDYLPICRAGDAGAATAALRTRQFVEGFAGNGSLHPICADDFSAAMQQIGLKLRVSLPRPCLTAPLVDTGADPGVQPQCLVSDVAPGAPPVLLPRCDATTSHTPCWRLSPDPLCTASGFEIAVERGGALPPAGTQQAIKCLTCSRPDDPRCAR